MMDSPVVTIQDGALRGAREGGVCVWRGIPYGVAPTGRGRFHPCQPAQPWQGVREATRFGLICPQPPDPMDALFGLEPPPSGEDCLSLNVWTPAAADGARRPVMVWIHGGGFENGSSAYLWYDGTSFARDGDVVVVSLNYRLGPLGFLCLDELDDDLGGSGNAGLFDQITALRWVRANIAAFGGDPENVTIFGESAGAMSIAALLGMPAARRLFHKAILQSGAARHIHTLEHATGAALAIMERLGLARHQVAALYEIPVERLLDAARAVESEGRYNLPLLFQPVVDGVTLPEWPILGPARGASAERPNIPMLIGTTREESRLFTVRDPALSALDENGLLVKVVAIAGLERGPAMLRAYRETRPDETPLHVWDAIYTDGEFRVPALRVAERLASEGSPVWMYRFDFAMPTLGGVFGACHGLDVPFVWNGLDKPAAALLVGDTTGAPALARRMQAAWVAFARGGDPNTAELPHWPAYALEGRSTMLFNLDCAVASDPASDERRLWEGVL